MGYLEKAKNVMSTFKATEVQGLPESELIQRHIATQEYEIAVYSKALDREIRIRWKSNDPKVIYLEQPAYTSREVNILKNADPKGIKAAHLVKEIFGGKILEEDGGFLASTEPENTSGTD